MHVYVCTLSCTSLQVSDDVFVHRSSGAFAHQYRSTANSYLPLQSHLLLLQRSSSLQQCHSWGHPFHHSSADTPVTAFAERHVLSRHCPLKSKRKSFESEKRCFSLELFAQKIYFRKGNADAEIFDSGRHGPARFLWLLATTQRLTQTL